ncbi:unnamed protein product [Lota lota]
MGRSTRGGVRERGGRERGAVKKCTTTSGQSLQRGGVAGHDKTTLGARRQVSGSKSLIRVKVSGTEVEGVKCRSEDGVAGKRAGTRGSSRRRSWLHKRMRQLERKQSRASGRCGEQVIWEMRDKGGVSGLIHAGRSEALRLAVSCTALLTPIDSSLRMGRRGRGA